MGFVTCFWKLVDFTKPGCAKWLLKSPSQGGGHAGLRAVLQGGVPAAEAGDGERVPEEAEQPQVRFEEGVRPLHRGEEGRGELGSCGEEEERAQGRGGDREARAGRDRDWSVSA